MFSPARRYGLSGAERVSEQNVSRHGLGRPNLLLNRIQQMECSIPPAGSKFFKNG
jgi:hypothetical protein